MNRTQKFDQMIQDLTHKRGEDYGHPLINFRNASALQAICAQCPNPEIRHALSMICVKIGRLIETPDHYDSILDIAGYARTMMMVLDAQEVDQGMSKERYEGLLVEEEDDL